MVVFMNISSLRLTFIAMMIINDDDNDDTVVVPVRDSASWLRIRLEYIYTLFIMTSTDMAATLYPHQNIRNDTDMMEQVFQQHSHCIAALLTCGGTLSFPNRHHHRNNMLPQHCHSDAMHPASILTSGIIPTFICDNQYNHSNHNNSNNNTETTNDNDQNHAMNRPMKLRHSISNMIQHHICNFSCRPGGNGSTTTTTTTATPPNIMAALLFIHQQYVTIVQHPSTILHGSDLVLIPSFLQRQLLSSSTSPSSSSSSSLQPPSPPNEIWVPLCLPRLYSSGYVYCYATNIHIGTCQHETGADHSTGATNAIPTSSSLTTTSIPQMATLCLISTIGTTDEFQILRTISQQICQSIHQEHITDYSCGDDDPVNDNSPDHPEEDHDYELIASFTDVSSTLIESMNNNNISSIRNNNINHDNYSSIPTQNNSRYNSNHTVSFMSAIGNMIDATASNVTNVPSSQLHWKDWIHQRYLRTSANNAINRNNIVLIRHFVFRVNVPIIKNVTNKGKSGKKRTKDRNTSSQQQDLQQQNGGHLVQCICSSYGDHCGNEATGRQQQEEQRLWMMYHKLQLRLRCGSSNSNVALQYAIDHNRNVTLNQNDITTSSLKTKPARKVKQSAPTERPTIDKDCPMIALSESLPNMDGMTYITENDTITYFAMNGNGFELYVHSQQILFGDNFIDIVAVHSFLYCFISA